MQRIVRHTLVLAGLALVLAGCGASQESRMRDTATTPAPSSELSRTAPASVSRRRLAAIGTTQDVQSNGARLAVTLRSVIDPLRDSGAALQRGTRAVGVVFQIRSDGSRIYDSSATGDISISVAAGTVTPVLATHGPCKTPVEDFDRYISAGEDRVGCVVFAIDDAAAIEAVRFAPHARVKIALTWAG